MAERSYDPDDTIPAEPPWQPALQPRRPPPPHGDEYPQGGFEGPDARVQVSQFWKKIVGGILKCGESREIQDKYTVGVEQSATEEIGAAIEASFGPFKESIGSKLQETLQTSHARELTYTDKPAAPPCEELIYVTWQLVERFVVTRRRSFGRWGPPQSYYRADEFTSPDRLAYPTDRCCRETRRQIEEGFNELFVLRYPGLSRVVLGRTLADGRIELAALAGPVRPGEPVPSTGAGSALQFAVPADATGVLEEYRGPLDFLSEDPALQRQMKWARRRDTHWPASGIGLGILAGALGGLAAVLLRRAGGEAVGARSSGIGQAESVPGLHGTAAVSEDGERQVREQF
jgi:hypothetical protein